MNEKVIPTTGYYKQNPSKGKAYIDGVKIHVPLKPLIRLMVWTWYYSLQYKIMKLRGLIK